MGTTPPRLVSPTVGLIPTTLLTFPGHTMLPSVSVPIETAAKLAAAAAAEPELDPHALRSSEYGLCVRRPRTELCGHGRVGQRGLTGKRERPRGRLHPVSGVDVVLEQDRNAVQRSPHIAHSSEPVGLPGERQGIRVDLEHRMDTWAALIQPLDAAQVIASQLHRGQLSRAHHRLELRDGGFVEMAGRFLFLFVGTGYGWGNERRS